MVHLTMRTAFLSVAIIFAATTLYAQAPVAAKQPKLEQYSIHKHVVLEKYDVVSMDTSICGKFGTMPMKGSEMRLYGNRHTKDTLIAFNLLGLDGKQRVRVQSPFMSSNGWVAFKIFGEPMIGSIRDEHRKDGDYLIMNFPTDPEDIRAEERELALAQDAQEDLRMKDSEERLAQMRKGYDWVFRKK